MDTTTVVNVRRSDFDIYIGRGRCPKTGKTSVWGNPYSHNPWAAAKYLVDSRTEAIKRYESYVRRSPELLARLPMLKGKRLGCWCYPLPCHGDILIKLIKEHCP